MTMTIGALRDAQLAERVAANRDVAESAGLKEAKRVTYLCPKEVEPAIAWHRDLSNNLAALKRLDERIPKLEAELAARLGEAGEALAAEVAAADALPLKRTILDLKAERDHILMVVGRFGWARTT